ncbi:hypothetical protein LTR10_008624 [Elasticomyces elasticus]|nr:hypothetical protein LTR10_008624 [Elasticomyces elasticus]
MLAALNDKDYGRLRELISNADETYCPQRNVSRINPDVAPNWESIAEHLLMQPHASVLRALIDNTLPHRALHELFKKVRTPVKPTQWTAGKPDCVVYGNSIADRSGDGMDSNDFERTMDAVEALTCTTMRPGNPFASNQALAALRNDFGRAHANLTGNAQNTDFWAKISASEARNLPHIGRAFVVSNRARIPIARQNNQQMMFRTEIGWTKEWPNRAQTHRRLYPASPPIFRLVQCAVAALFPNRGFRMHQFAIFEITRPEEALIGESIATHLAAGYITYGGFNVDTAGVTASRILTDRTVDWVQVSTDAIKSSYFRHYQINLPAREAFIAARKQQMQAREAAQKRVEQMTHLTAVCTTAAESLIDQNVALDQAIMPIQSDLDSIDRIYQDLKKQAIRRDKAEHAITELASSLAALCGE